DSAALPTAASQTRAGAGARAVSASRTQRRPSTPGSRVRNSPSSNSRRGSGASASSAPAHHFESGAPLAARVLRRIGALQLQPLEIFGGDVAGGIFTREARGVELLDARILVLARGDQVLEILVDEPVCADQARHFLHGTAARDQFAHRRHVDAVDVREAYRW